MAMHASMIMALQLTVFLSLLSFVFGKVQNSAPLPPVPRLALNDHPLWPNLNQNFSWEDPALRQRLWNGITASRSKLSQGKELQKSLRKRDPTYPPLIALPACIQCKVDERPVPDGSVTLADFTAAKLLTKTLPLATLGTCVFYTQRPQGMDPRSLSVPMKTTLICTSLLYRSIWDLWPDKGTGCDPESTYYCLDPWTVPRSCCWLNPLIVGGAGSDPVALALPYFQQMSEAYAQTCSGDVYVVADDPTKVGVDLSAGSKPSIWLTHELPALQSLFNSKKVTSLKAFRVVNNVVVTTNPLDRTDLLSKTTKRQVEWDEATNERIQEMARAIKEVRRRDINKMLAAENDTAESDTHVFQKRSCGNAENWEPPGIDIFG